MSLPTDSFQKENLDCRGEKNEVSSSSDHQNGDFTHDASILQKFII